MTKPYELALRMRYKLTAKGIRKANEKGVKARIRRLTVSLVPTDANIRAWVLRWLLGHPNGMSVERLHSHAAGWMSVGDLYHMAIIPLKRSGYIERTK